MASPIDRTVSDSLRTQTYHKSKRHIDYDEKEERYLSEVTDPNKEFGNFGVEEIGNQISKYNSKLLNAPFKICCCFPGSFCYYLGNQKWLLFEEFFYAALFFLIVYVTATNRFNIIPNVVVETNTLGTLVAFFLGFYVSLNISRWWRLRTDGIGNIWSATSGMATLLGPRYEVYRDNHINANKDKEILKRILVHLKRIQRYCQSSLALVFSTNGQKGFSREDLVARGIMTKEEDENLQKKKSKAEKTVLVKIWRTMSSVKSAGRTESDESSSESVNVGIPGSYPEYMWSLISRELEILKDEIPDFMSNALDISLQTQVLKGRSGAGLIAAQLGAQLPLTYAHGVTLLGKLYNVILCVTSAITFVNLYVTDLKAANPDRYAGKQIYQIVDHMEWFFAWNVAIGCIMLLVKTSCISLLLVLCEHLSNPFDDDLVSYPGLRYVKWIFMDFEILLGFSIKNQYQRIIDGYYCDRGKVEQETVEELALTYGLIKQSDIDKGNGNLAVITPAVSPSNNEIH